MQKISARKFHFGPPFTSFDHLVGAQTQTFLIRLLLAVVPDIGCKLPVASDLLPHYEIFAGDFFRHRTLGLEAEEHTSELQSRPHLVCRLLLEKKKKQKKTPINKKKKKKTKKNNKKKQKT